MTLLETVLCLSVCFACFRFRFLSPQQLAAVVSYLLTNHNEPSQRQRIDRTRRSEEYHVDTSL
jgi:hypothetical protein